MRFRSLRALTLTFLLAFLVATLGTGLAIHSATRQTVEQLVDRRILAVNDSVGGGNGARRPADILRRIEAAIRQRDTGDIGFVLRAADGHVLAGNITPSRRLPLGFSTLEEGDRIAGLSAGRSLVRNVGGGMTLTTIAETEPFDDADAALVRITVIGFGSIVLLVVGGTLAFAMTVRRRIGAVRVAVDAIIDGDVGHRIPVDRSDGEFAQLAVAFNRMLDRIAELMANISNVSNDIAHDLRTPLARLRSQLALSLEHAVGDRQRDDLTAAIAMSDDVLAMFAAILRIAELEEGDRRAAFTSFDLAALVDDVASMMQPVVVDGGRTLVIAAAPRTPIVGDRQLLGQIVVNLIENAIRHTPVGSRIEIAIATRGDFAILSVTDDGPGIPDDRHDVARRRFGRLDQSRHDSGHGLGLPLVDAIAKLHRGTLALEDAGPGLRVVVSLPKGLLRA
ncbi:ATP-binding protein [Sphingomonas sp. M1A8_2b]